VAALFATPAFAPIAGLGICAEKRVRSVLLRCRHPLAKIRTVELDPASRTSNALARVLFRRHWKQPVRFAAGPLAVPADAAVVIGDRALCEPPGPAGDLDLAEHWNRLTGLPFVFAVWAHRRDHPHATALARCVHAAKVAGVALIPELARLQAAKLGLSEDVCRDYFATCIYYDTGPREVLAMERFRAEIAEMEEAESA
jgi:chorismate dehydratase